MRTEVRRGRKFIEYQDDSFPAGTLVQEIGAHDVNYLDDSGNWQACDENWLTDGADGYIVKADKLNHKVRLNGNGGRAWYPRRNVATEYLTFGIPQYWTGSKWRNFGFSGWSVDGKTITLNTRQNVTILVHSLWSGIKIDWVLANSSAPKRMRYPVTLTGITESEGVLYGADNTELGRLTPTTATDANGLELACTGAYAGGYVEFSADVTGAVYPVTIDPDFAAGSSFGRVRGRSTTYLSARSTSDSFITTDIQVGQEYFSSFYYVLRGFIQFDTSSIGVNGTVNQVNLRMVCTIDYSVTDFDLQIVKYNWSSQDPLAADNREDAFDGCLAAAADDSIWRNTNGMSVNTQYTSGNLSTAWINKTGTTYYGLRSNLDESATQPADESSIYIAQPTHATESYRPVLIVAYSGGSTAYSLTCAAGSYSLAGVACTLTYTKAAQNLTLACAAGSYAVTGTDATLSVKRNYSLACDAGSYALTGSAVSFEVKRNYVLAMGAGSYTLTGSSATFTVLRNYTLTLGAGSYAQSGSSATLEVKRNYVLACNAGSYAQTGTDASFVTLRNYTFACAAGSYAQTGVDATFEVKLNYSLACDAGSYTLTGTDATFLVQRHFVLACEAGSYSLTGTDEAFVLQRHFTLSADAGSYSLTGTDCTLTYTSSAQALTLTCNAGSFTLTGTNAGLTSVRTLAIDSGSYSLTGADAGLFKGLVMPCESDSYELTGSLANLFKSLILTTESGTYLLTGTDADLLYTKYFPYAEFWDGTVRLTTSVDGSVILNLVVDGNVTVENIVIDTASVGELWGNSYWGNSYWGNSYWGYSAGNSGMNEIVERIVKLNRAINGQVVLNKEITDTYSELEAI